MPLVRFEQVWKLYGDVPAVLDLNLEIQDGEFLVFVGPSGCGKTTSLRMLAGLEPVTYGSLFFGDDDVTRLPPGKRDISMVFQSYALYPTMTVAKNLSFGPTVRRDDKANLRRRVEEVAKILDIGNLLDRKPSDLSGGQRQRVALGRALIRQPQLFLLDEPLSNLDAALRVQMREEIVRLHALISATTVYVTHDQVEAMTMGDRIAVMNKGHLLQVGTPAELFDNPRDLFVATFVGTPRMNTFPGAITTDEEGGLVVSSLGASAPLLPWQVQQLQSLSPGTDLTLGLRSSDIHWEDGAVPRSMLSVDGTVRFMEHLGAESYASVDVHDTSLRARLPRTCGLDVGDSVRLAFGPADLYFFDSESQLAVVERPASTASRNPDRPAAAPTRA